MGEEQSIEILFEHERDTKRTGRFQETACLVNGEPTPGMATGTLYIQKWALENAFGSKMPKAVDVKITLHPVDEE